MNFAELFRPEEILSWNTGMTVTWVSVFSPVAIGVLTYFTLQRVNTSNGRMISTVIVAVRKRKTGAMFLNQ